MTGLLKNVECKTYYKFAFVSLLVILFIYGIWLGVVDLIAFSLIILLSALILKYSLKDSIKANLFKTRYSIRHDLALHEHGVFWIPIAIFFTAALWVGLFSTDFNPSLLISNPLLVVEALKTPITILALCIPFTVAIGRFHGSEQQKKKIQESEEVKSFKHYFDHREAFVNYTSKLDRGSFFGTLSIKEPLKLYEIFFPNATMTSFSIAPTLETGELIRQAIDNTLTKLDQDNASARENERVSFLDNGTVHILRDFGIEFKVHNTTSPQELNGYITNLSKTCIDNLRHILEFADEFNRHETLITKDIRSLLKKASSLPFPSFNARVSDEIRSELKKMESKGTTRRVRLI